MLIFLFFFLKSLYDQLINDQLTCVLKINPKGDYKLLLLFLKAQKKEEEEMRRNNEELLKDEKEKLKIEKLMQEKRRVRFIHELNVLSFHNVFRFMKIVFVVHLFDNVLVINYCATM